MLLHAVIGGILHQPPLAVLLQQLAISLLVAKNADYCATPLLSDTLSRRRLQALTRALDAVPMFIFPPQASDEPGEGRLLRGTTAIQ